MNFSLPSGLVMGAAIIIWAISTEMENPIIFANPHGIIIVLGGTLAAALVCFKFSHFLNLFVALKRALFGEHKKNSVAAIKVLHNLSKILNDGRSIQEEVAKIPPSFLKESLELFLEGSLTNQELIDVLDKRVELQNEMYRRENSTFKIIGKFPPAFGLIGATLGMIGLLQGLGSPDGFKKLGPSMSVALTATFWGLVFANLIVIPIGEYLSDASDEDLIMRRIVVDGIVMLSEKKHPLIVEEYLVSYLSPSQRNKVGMADAKEN